MILTFGDLQPESLDRVCKAMDVSADSLKRKTLMTYNSSDSEPIVIPKTNDYIMGENCCGDIESGWVDCVDDAHRCVHCQMDDAYGGARGDVILLNSRLVILPSKERPN